MTARFGAAIGSVFFASLCTSVSASAQQDGKQLGSVHFETSCSQVAQRRFDRAMRYQHSFWYSQSKAVFEDALKADPNCTVAYWGIALALLLNPHNDTLPENWPAGLAALQKAKAQPSKTERERDYVESLLALYADYDKVDRRTRQQRYLKATEELARKYPKDDEAQINYAITLNVAASPADKTYANQLKGAAILEPLFKKLPHHPGIAHYLIHLYDYPAIAEKGLPAALRYASIAPAAPHAQHMPSHIFTRVGYWKESIKSNLASARTAKADKEWDDQLHGMDYLVYAYLQLARDREAEATVGEIAGVPAGQRPSGNFARAAGPARLAMERGDWKAASQLAIQEDRAQYVPAISHFARALGAARSGNPDAAKADVARLRALSVSLREAKDAYWSNIVDIQARIAGAWGTLAEGKADEALAAMSAAADDEDKTEKAPVTPGPLAPARELLGEMQLQQGRAAEALASFERTLAKEPNRFRALAGAAVAAAKAGNADKARTYSKRLVDIAAEAGSKRPEVETARQYLASK